MKRFCSLLVLIMTIMVFGGAFAWADVEAEKDGNAKGDLEILNLYPEDGKTGFQPVNMPVKIVFNKDVSAKANRAKNIKAMKLTNSKGKEIPVKVIFHPDEKDKVMVLAKKDLKNDMEYTFEISDKFVATDGTHLNKTTKTTFSTRDTKKDSRGNMLLMALMVVGIVIFSVKSAQHQVKKEREKEEKVNPYKVAKETGKSVESVVKEEQKKKAKSQAKKDAEAAKIEKERAKYRAKNATGKEVLPPNHYAVKAKKPISAAGSSYKSGKKAQLEARKEAQRMKKNAPAKRKTGKKGAKRK